MLGSLMVATQGTSDRIGAIASTERSNSCGESGLSQLPSRRSQAGTVAWFSVVIGTNPSSRAVLIMRR